MDMNDCILGIEIVQQPPQSRRLFEIPPSSHRRPEPIEIVEKAGAVTAMHLDRNRRKPGVHRPGHSKKMHRETCIGQSHGLLDGHRRRASIHRARIVDEHDGHGRLFRRSTLKVERMASLPLKGVLAHNRPA